MTREDISRAIADAPVKVVVSLSLTVLVALGGWVWTIADDVSDQRATAAVAAAEARSANVQIEDVRAELRRINDKLDRLLEAFVDPQVRRRNRDREQENK